MQCITGARNWRLILGTRTSFLASDHPRPGIGHTKPWPDQAHFPRNVWKTGRHAACEGKLLTNTFRINAGKARRVCPSHTASCPASSVSSASSLEQYPSSSSFRSSSSRILFWERLCTVCALRGHSSLGTPVLYTHENHDLLGAPKCTTTRFIFVIIFSRGFFICP